MEVFFETMGVPRTERRRALIAVFVTSSVRNTRASVASLISDLTVIVFLVREELKPAPLFFRVRFDVRRDDVRGYAHL